ncbi:alpha/beta fold hydrolase [Listeria fleischmannii]|uniref:alpha/beta fold hydrolase n=1 Tax=Listeria fleischmannii TaxID=1069827 RepID=UPI001629F6F4|nr:alpha/beta fold hydrolase [Listeria fleischmannii]MBC1420051.1 alpha/beta hydrolase [Listeria fleischmannii]
MKLTDREVNKLSQEAYRVGNFKDSSTKFVYQGKEYYILDKLNEKGVNALTLGSKEDYKNMQAGHPERITQAIISFRGSEPLSLDQVLQHTGNKGWNNAGKTAGGAVAFGNEVKSDWLDNDLNYLIKKQTFDNGQENGFTIASDYVNQLHKTKLKNAKFDVLGHSYGGSQAQYVLTTHPDIVHHAYSLEGPNIYPCLTKEQQTLVKSGQLNSKLTHYLNMTDGLARLNRDEYAFGINKIIYDPNANYAMKHQEAATYLKTHPIKGLLKGNIAQIATYEQLNGVLKSINPSLSYMMLFTFADHNLDRYQFGNDGSVKLMSDQSFSMHNLEQMKDYLVTAGVGEYSAPLLLIRGEILLHAANRCETRCDQIIRQLERVIQDIPEEAQSITQKAKLYFERLMGYGDFTELHAGHVEAFHAELEIEPGRFYKQKELETAEEAVGWMKEKTAQYVEQIRRLAHEFLKLDEVLAEKMDLR